MPDPFEPTSATTSPVPTAMSMPSRIAWRPGPTASPQTSRASTFRRAGGEGDTGRSLNQRGSSPRWARASSTDSGRGSHPSAAPNSTTDGGLVSSAAMSRGASGPVASPLSTINRRSARASRLSSRCSARTTALPAAASPKHAAITAVAPSGSSCEVGSSRATSSGRRTSTAASCTSCRSPPESVASRRRRRPTMPIAPSVSSTRSCIWERGTPRFSRPKATSRSTVP